MDIVKLFEPQFSGLYGAGFSSDFQNERYCSLMRRHYSLFGEKNPMVFSSAGRTEIIGNHTDHNNGKVVGASINLDAIAAVSLRTDSLFVFESLGYPRVTVDLNELEAKPEETNTVAALIRGVAAAFRNRKLEIGGMNMNLSSTIGIGSGVSSSAAIENLISAAFSSAFNAGRLSQVEIARIGQWAENNYFGKPSGLLDQLTAAFGGVVSVDFRNSDNPEIKRLTLDLSEFGYEMILTNTRGSHADLTDEYASIPGEMNLVASFFGKRKLREVDRALFFSQLPEVRAFCNNDRAVLRACHFFNENDRVSELEQCIRNRDFKKYLSIIAESGKSSGMYLQNIYRNSVPSVQEVNLALVLSERILCGEGASRIHGGGFGGVIQSYVPRGLVNRYIEEMEAVFGAESCIRIQIRKQPVCRLAV